MTLPMQTHHLLATTCLAALAGAPLAAQNIRPDLMNTADEQQRRDNPFARDSVEKTNVPEGIYAWTVGRRFGDIRPTVYDTVPHAFQNEAFTSGPTGHYNYTGNLGAPRISRFFREQSPSMMVTPFIFTTPYDFFVRSEDEVMYTNTKSPFTNITYHECGNKTNGEDRFKALFSVNSGKRLGMGFKTDYLYGRGYYQGQSTAHFDGTLFSSYIADRYQMHLSYSYKQLKNRENGGIENDDYVNRPESFPTRYGTGDMPINLDKAWNKMRGNTLFLTHRYNTGFHRYVDKNGHILTQAQVDAAIKAALPKQEAATAPQQPTDSLTAPKAQPRLPRLPEPTEEEQRTASREVNDSLGLREEFVPVTSVIHTLKLYNNSRTFTSHVSNNADSPGFYSDFYLPGDSARDVTKQMSIENTLAFELHEGFNKWMKTGLRLYGRHQFNRFTLPDEQKRMVKYTENYITLGAQILKQTGNIFRYDVLGEFRTSGSDWGEFNVEGNVLLNIPLPGDSLRFTAQGFVRNERPSFYFRHYHGRNAWWDNTDLNKVFHARIGATLAYKGTSLSATLENIQNHLYFAESLIPTEASDGYTTYRHGVHVAQAGKNAQLLELTLAEKLAWGIFHWDTELTYQTSTNKDVLPVPAFTGYTNVYLLFRIAKVLRTELGADVRYFTAYKAPAYSPIIGQYAMQDADYAVKVGNYPIINAYVNFHLKRTRFYVMASHVNYSAGSGKPFLVPHYPLNRMVIRFGISWNFVN